MYCPPNSGAQSRTSRYAAASAEARTRSPPAQPDSGPGGGLLQAGAAPALIPAMQPDMCTLGHRIACGGLQVRASVQRYPRAILSTPGTSGYRLSYKTGTRSSTSPIPQDRVSFNRGPEVLYTCSFQKTDVSRNPDSLTPSSPPPSPHAAIGSVACGTRGWIIQPIVDPTAVTMKSS